MNKVALAGFGSTEFNLRQFFVARGYRCAVVNNGSTEHAGQPRYYRYLKMHEESSAQDYHYAYNLMFIREGSGLYPEDMI